MKYLIYALLVVVIVSIAVPILTKPVLAFVKLFAFLILYFLWISASFKTEKVANV